MRVTSWGELDDSWLGREVIVRWEDATDTGPDSQSGLPHEWRGTIVNEAHGLRGDLWLEHALAFTSGFPDHALVQEVNGVDADDR